MEMVKCMKSMLLNLIFLAGALFLLALLLSKAGIVDINQLKLITTKKKADSTSEWVNFKQSNSLTEEVIAYCEQHPIDIYQPWPGHNNERLRQIKIDCQQVLH